MKKLAILTLIFCIVLMFATSCFTPNNGGEGSGEQGGSGEGSGEGGGEGSGEQGGSGEGGGETPDDPGEGGETPDDPGEGGETPDNPDDPGEGGETPDNPDDPGQGGETPDNPDDPGQGGETPDEPVAPSVDPSLFETLPSGAVGFDFDVPANSYATYTSTAGWVAVNSAIQSGQAEGLGDANPKFEFIGDDSVFAVALNGKVGAAGTLTSPLLGNGIKSLSFKYGFAFSDTQASITVNIFTAEGLAATKTYEFADLTSKTVYTAEVWTLDEAISGNFVIQFVNNCKSEATGNKDRLSIWDISWDGVAPEVVDFDCIPRADVMFVDTKNQPYNTVTAVVKGEGEDKVTCLELNKTNYDPALDGPAASGAYRQQMRIFQYVTKVDEGANKAVFSTKLYIEEMGAGHQFEIYLRSGNGYDVDSTKETQIKESPVMWLFTDNNAADANNVTGKAGKGEAGTINIPEDEWVDIRVEYVVTSVSADNSKVTGIRCDFYVNGTLAASSKTAYGEFLEINGGTFATPFADEISHMCMIFYGGNIGKYYFDDMSLQLVKADDLSAPEVDEPEPEIPVTLEDFNKSTELPGTISVTSLPENQVSIVAKAEGDNALKIVKGGNTTTVKPNKAFTTEENAIASIFSFDLLIEEVTNTGHIELWIVGGGADMIPYITLGADGTTSIYDLRHKVDTVDAGITYGKWVHIDVIYSASAWEYRVNGKTILTGDGVKGGAAPALMTEMRASFDSAFKGTFQVDNVAFNNVAAIPASPYAGTTFEDGAIPSKITVAGVTDAHTATVVDDGEGNKVLKYTKVDEVSGSMQLTYTGVDYVEDNANVTVFEVDLKISGYIKGSGLEVYPFSAGNKTYLCYITVAGDVVNYQHNAGGDKIALGKTGEWISIQFKFYKDVAGYTLFVNGENKGSFDAVKYNAPGAFDTFNKVNFFMGGSMFAEFYYDNIKLYQAYEAPVVEEPEEPGEGGETPVDPNPGEGGEGGETPVEPKPEEPKPEEPKIGTTFEDGAIPSYLVPFVTEGNTATVVDKGEGNKALFYDKTVNASSGHTLNFQYNNLDATAENANVAVIKFDLLVENFVSGAGIEMYPKTANGNTYLLYITIGGGKVKFQHNAGGDAVELGDVGSWITIEFKYYEATDSYKLLANGAEIGEYTGLFKATYVAPTCAEDFVKFGLNIGTQMLGDFYFDNISVSHVYEEAKAPETPETPEEPSEEETVKNIVLTVDSLGVASNSYESKTCDIEGTSFEYIQIGNYGDGIQVRDKNGNTSSLWNTAAFGKAIAKIELVYSSTKDVTYANPDCEIFAFGNEAKAQDCVVKLSTTAGVKTYTITPDAETYTYLYFEHDLGYTMYWESITIYFVD